MTGLNISPKLLNSRVRVALKMLDNDMVSSLIRAKRRVAIATNNKHEMDGCLALIDATNKLRQALDSFKKSQEMVMTTVPKEVC